MRHDRRLTGGFGLFLMVAACALSPVIAGEGKGDDSQAYDAELAQRLGADEYGMRSYFLVILTTGAAEITDEERRRELFSGHFSNMSRMAEAGQLMVAGPLMDAPPKRGLFVLNAESFEAAEALVKTDPAVAAGIFDYEIVKWYGSAAMMMINEIHPRLQSKAIE